MHRVPATEAVSSITVVKSGILAQHMKDVQNDHRRLGASVGELRDEAGRDRGRYNSKSEVLREGIRLIQEREARLAVLDQALARGIEDAETRLAKPLADVVARLEWKYEGASLRSDFECSSEPYDCSPWQADSLCVFCYTMAVTVGCKSNAKWIRTSAPPAHFCI